VTWVNLSLVSLIIAFSLILVTSWLPRLWSTARPIVVLAFQASGIFVTTWLLMSFARPVPGSNPFARELALLSRPVPTVLLLTSVRSLLLMGLAIFWATLFGLGTAILMQSLLRKQLLPIGAVAAVIWILPTFILAILVQEFQAFVAGHTGLVIAAGFGAVNPVQVFWAAVVLGVRPAAYLFRHSEQLLDLEVALDYVRTARAKGLPWRKVVTRHVVRGALPSILSAWMNSFRLMIGSLPLVEYFFGYPGLGRVLVLSVGVGPGLGAQVRGDLAVGLVVTMALILVVVEAVIGFTQRRVDPRLSESALAAA